ncbi:unnamed protein product [Symbiodinium microadriaticum]|nr:unnamed protein product [Symbiodinium sp. KB8]CAE7178511.1 unnamed protein product [Symbiodinium microadriaticum]
MEALKRPNSFELKESALLAKAGETEDERMNRIAHNVFMKYSRSIRSSNCPPEVLNAAKSAVRGSKALDDMFAEYLNCGGQWLRSSLCTRVETSVSKSLQGQDIYIRLCDLRKQEGDTVANEIFESKKKLQEQLPEGSPEHPYILKHPDLPGANIDVAVESQPMDKKKRNALINQAELDIHAGCLRTAKGKVEACPKGKAKAKAKGKGSSDELGPLELKMHGAKLPPCADKIRRGGAGGIWTQNVERDTLRSLGAYEMAINSVPLQTLTVPMVKSATDPTIVEKLSGVVESLNLLFNGVTVMGDDGVETQVHAAVTELRADWKFYRETLRRYVSTYFHN